MRVSFQMCHQWSLPAFTACARAVDDDPSVRYATYGNGGDAVSFPRHVVILSRDKITPADTTMRHAVIRVQNEVGCQHAHAEVDAG